ncbi:hypothetical protein JHK85_004737 [Glycine max]|nr:hypothetical protein JHK85_004737 [Glycine max]
MGRDNYLSTVSNVAKRLNHMQSCGNTLLRQRLSLCPLDNNLVNLALHEERFQKIIRNFFSRFKIAVRRLKFLATILPTDFCPPEILNCQQIFDVFERRKYVFFCSGRPLPSGRITIFHVVGWASSVGLADRSNIVTWKFATTDLECKAGIAHNGGLVPLLKLLDSKNGPLQHNAAFALYGLADNEATIDCVAKSLKRLEKKIHDRMDLPWKVILELIAGIYISKLILDVLLGGPVKEIGPKIEVDVLSLNCNAKKVVKVVPEDSTQNGIEDMDVDGANGVGKGGPVAKIEVVRVETLANVQDAETEVVYVSPEDDGQTSDTSNDGYHFEEFESSQQ